MPIHAKKNGNTKPTTEPALQRNDWMLYALAFCDSFTMSPTNILKGCIAMLILVSRSISMSSPKIIAAENVSPKEPAFGNRHITSTATVAPMNR